MFRSRPRCPSEIKNKLGRVQYPPGCTERREQMSKIETKCLHAGYTPGNGEPRQLPIYQSITFKYSSSEQMGAIFDLKSPGYIYTRLQNPTNDAVATRIAAVSYTHLRVCAAQYDLYGDEQALPAQAGVRRPVSYTHLSARGTSSLTRRSMSCRTATK